MVVEDNDQFYWDEISENLQQFLTQLSDFTLDTVEHLIIGIFLYIATCILLYVAVAHWKLLSFNRDAKDSKKASKGGKRVLFVIAHPDDECMFFGPSILNFTTEKNCCCKEKYQVFLVCLSSALGGVRRRELYESCKTLGIPADNITVHSHTNLPDAMDVRWPAEIVGKIILNYLEIYDINILVTFDRHGVSGHSNHYSIYYAVADLFLRKQLPKTCEVLTLETVNILRKYWMLDLPITLILSRIRYLVSCKKRRRIIKAMKQHKSQMVWFRYLYIYFSRYLLINSLQQMNLIDVELDLALDD